MNFGIENVTLKKLRTMLTETSWLKFWKRKSGLKLRVWMWNSTMTVNFSIFVNGGLRGKILSTRGLRKKEIGCGHFLFL